MREKQNLSEISLEEGSESLRDLGMVVPAEGTARLESPPCVAHSAQLLSFHPSGLLSGSLPLRRALADSNCPSSIKDRSLTVQTKGNLTSHIWFQFFSSSSTTSSLLCPLVPSFCVHCVPSAIILSPSPKAYSFFRSQLKAHFLQTNVDASHHSPTGTFLLTYCNHPSFCLSISP